MATRNVPAICPHCGSLIRKSEEVPDLRAAIEIEIARNRLVRLDRGQYVDGIFCLTINDIEFTITQEEANDIWPWLIRLWQNAYESPVRSQS